ncbi:MAG TPA: DNA translocase FtsK 4TM domain-containing protein, partial [Acetobacteraceae bacterium]
MASARTVETRRLASPTIRALIQQRSAELTGLILGLLGLALLVALACYDPRDPSLNTASSRQTTNLAGPLGAMLADLLLQGFGLAGAVPGVAMLTWAWRIASRRGLGSVGVRVAALVAALPVDAGVFASLPMPRSAAWPTVAGLGGALGSLLAKAGLAAGRDVLGPVGSAIIWTMGLALAISLTLLALGLSTSEWRTAGHGVRQVVRFAFLRSCRAPSFRLPRLPGWLAFRRHPKSVARPEPELPIRFAAPMDEPAQAVPRMTRPAPVPRLRPRQESLPLPESGWRFPPLSLLKPPPALASSGPSREALEANARLLESVLSDYGVQGSIVEIRPGPVVTLYELEPAPGIRSARVIGLADDVARSLSVTAVRIATVPGRSVIGIEVPNVKRETVFLSEILSSDELHKQGGRLTLALGKEINGAPLFADLARMPHLMIAGTTGSGKSVGVNAMILSLLYRLSPDQCRLILIDPKMLELSMYEGIPHLMAPVVTEPAKAVTALKWTVREMERRYRAMSQLGVRNLTGYNDRVADARAKGEVITRRVQTGFDPDTGRPTFEEQPLALEP